MPVSNPSDDFAAAPEDSVRTGALEALKSFEVIKRALAPYASLKITVVLFALSIFLVLAGTLAQVDKDIWQVIHEYFRCFYTWIPFQIFFPPSFFPSKPQIPGGVYFPGGWTIGVALWVNLFAAHISRFTIQAKGSRRLWGGITLLLGIVITWLVIDSGSNVAGALAESTKEENSRDGLWALMQLLLGAAFLGSVYGAIQLRSDQRFERWLLAATAVILGSVLGLLVSLPDWRPDPSGMRILWQLVKGTIAGLVLLVGCWMLFQRRAGIVLLHAGIGLMMFNELYVGVTNVEGQMQIEEGETVNFVRDIRSMELAVIDRSPRKEDKVTLIPGLQLRRSGEKETPVSNDLLPFDVKTVQWLQNSTLRRVMPDDKSPASDGQGRYWLAEAVAPGTGTDKDSKVDISSAYVEFLEKGTGKSLGTRLLSLEFSERNEPERVTVDGHDYDVFLRFKRNYKPYSITLIDVQKNDYLGTSTPRDYRSLVKLVDPTRNTDRDDVKIWMNNPLRFAGETFYQSGYNESTRTVIDPSTGLPERKKIEITTLAVVSNAQWMIPYVGCMIVLVGMLAQFVLTLMRFLKRQDEAIQPGEAPLAAAASTAPQASETVESPARRRGSKHRHADAADIAPAPEAPVAAGFNYSRWIIPAAVLLLAGGYVASKARTPKTPAGQFDYAAFGRLPIVEQGRTKPFDTLARNALSIISGGRQEYTDEHGEKQPAIRWLLDVIGNDEAASKHRVFRIENLDVQSILGLEPRKEYRYSIDEIRPKVEVFNADVSRAKEIAAADRDVVQRKLIELDGRIRTFTLLHAAFHPPPLPPLPTPEEIAKRSPEASEKFSDFLGALNGFSKQLKSMNAPLAVSNLLTKKEPGADGKLPDDWEPYSVAWTRAYMMSEIAREAPPEGLAALNRIVVYYAKGDVANFNESVAKYNALLTNANIPEYNPAKVRFEAFFNRFSPFYYAAVLNVIAFILAALAWLGWSVPLNRAAFWLIAVNLAVHTFGMCARMYISGRPPVTNLYSSAVFIGWGAVVLGMILEGVFRLGIGNIVASVSGFATLVIAHMLAADGDTFTVLQAVLDTQFWLATHVTCITFGYATTFVAGLLGIVYIVQGVLSPKLTKQTSRELTRMIYGILCFATFFSFIGTVLGGLWADDSWGRFWGWDPKENGALIIVLWNALVLHARWGGMVKDRGLAVLAVGGNIVTSWSWFGVNELGVGLHSYGFTEGVLMALGIFCLSQLVIAGLGCLPKNVWMSSRNLT
jgi:ABC-type transport system involved in cytochrome c biogenesis permease subunit